MTMRVGIICPYSLSVPGGVQMQVLSLAKELRSRGLEARVLGPCDGPPPASFVTPLGKSLPTSANGSIAPLAPDPPAMFRTLQALAAERFDVVHLHEPMVPGPTLTAAVTHRYPTVGTFHAAGRSASYRLIKPWLLSWIKRIDHKVVVSKDALELVQSHLGGDYEVLFNGVEVEQIRETPPFVRQPDDSPAILFCGRHEERKGLDVLIDAFTRLDVAAELWIAGTGPDTARLTARTAGDDRIRWLGRITDEDKFARLRAAEVFCAPSLGGESFGVVLVEALAAGTTVVASGLDGYRNVVTDEHDALLCEPGDVDALVVSLRRALADRTGSQRLRAAAATRAEQFAMSALADRYIEIYHDLAQTRPRTLRP
ncbi:glycosyltransferase family 4 protein [Ilumatobacter sp.]|uniref:glycosyltransferase family 4 protein n=1 Tax=Ilumatobacter sp. TaxID=1967498 RepID=UPI003C465980